MHSTNYSHFLHDIKNDILLHYMHLTRVWPLRLVLFHCHMPYKTCSSPPSAVEGGLQCKAFVKTTKARCNSKYSVALSRA